MADNNDNDTILRQIWYPEESFGSQKQTYDEAKKLIPNITVNEVKTWSGKQKWFKQEDLKFLIHI